MFWVKEHATSFGELLVAGCDSDILGKSYEDSEFSFKISSAFYGGKEVDEKTFLVLAKKCSILNIIGDDIVALAIKHKLIDPKNVRKIAGVSHAQSIAISEN